MDSFFNVINSVYFNYAACFAAACIHTRYYSLHHALKEFLMLDCAYVWMLILGTIGDYLLVSAGLNLKIRPMSWLVLGSILSNAVYNKITGKPLLFDIAVMETQNMDDDKDKTWIRIKTYKQQ